MRKNIRRRLRRVSGHMRTWAQMLRGLMYTHHVSLLKPSPNCNIVYIGLFKHISDVDNERTIKERDPELNECWVTITLVMDGR